ncbi:MAG: hypothetical protein CVU46_00785 [Chloroflexi bacterium HGW-Chloroflexi-8]|nr:MAG: hypothetical protein CVU46_00785 [Chloroflexi bacterium HGW-Chloroflexi-8]
MELGKNSAFKFIPKIYENKSKFELFTRKNLTPGWKTLGSNIKKKIYLLIITTGKTSFEKR